MFQSRPFEPQGDEQADRPYSFLVSTTGCVRDIRRNMGNADYSYAFVLKALTPLLDELGTWQLVSQPESSLAYWADRARAEGRRPIHLALQPPQNGYLTPAVPNVLFPFWEFPEIPSRDFGYDTRQNWLRMTSRADLILTACQFTANAFRSARVPAPVAVVPVPLDPKAFTDRPWNPEHSWTFECRHLVLGGRGEQQSGNDPIRALEPVEAPKLKRVARRIYQRLNGAYRRHVLRWLSEEGAERAFQAKNRLMRKAAIGPTLLPTSSLTLKGLTYTSVFNLGDRRKNIDDMLSAFILAFRDRPDVTLVLKLATNPEREYYEVKELRNRYNFINLDHDCRIVVITDYLPDAQMNDLMSATTYYVNTSRSEGACLPLQQALAAGRPALAPRHTALEDYIDEQVALVLRSHPEPTRFPHDTEPRLDTSWHRLVWADLHDRFRESAEIAEHDRDRYDALASAARQRMERQYSRTIAVAALRTALEALPMTATRPRLSWSA